MKKKRTIKDLFFVIVSRVLSIASGMAVGFLIPKILNVEGYGYYKVFTLYSSYAALLHFGFVDGILLRFAGNDYDKLEKAKMNTLSRFYIMLEFAIGSVMIVISFFIGNSDYSFILLMLGLFTIIMNITAYYQYISQAVSRFSEYSLVYFLQALFRLLFVLALLVLYFTNIYNATYKVYVVGIILLDLAALLWYMFSYRDITFGKGQPVRLHKAEIKSIFKNGIILTVAHQTANLVFALDRQFVSALFDIKTYAVYSLAYSAVYTIVTVVASISVVMFPMLKRVDKDSVNNYYTPTLTGVSIFSGLCIALYYPAIIFLGWFLPKYTGSFVYLQIVLPSLMLNCGISVVMMTFSKVLDDNLVYFRNAAIVLGVGFVSNLSAYLVFKNPESISYASLFTMAVWFVIEGKRIGKLVGSKIKKVFIYIILVTVGFLAISYLVANNIYAMLTYVVYYLIVTSAFYSKFITTLVKSRLLKNDKTVDS